MALVVRRYAFVGPSNTDLARTVGHAAAQSATFPLAVVDVQVDNAVAGAVDTLDERMAQLGWVFSAGASPPLAVQDEGISTGPSRSTLNFIGAGVGAVDDPGNGRVSVTIPGAVTDGAVVSRGLFKSDTVQTSGTTYVDGMSGSSVAVPIDGDYFVLFEGEGQNQNAAGEMEIAISINSTTVSVAASERRSKSPAADIRFVACSVRLNGLVAGNLIRCLFRRSAGAGTVALFRRNLTIIKVQ